MEERERLMMFQKRVPKAEIDRANKILEKHLNNTDNICKVVDAFYAMGRTIEEERKGLERNEKRKQKRENQDGPNRGYGNLKTY